MARAVLQDLLSSMKEIGHGLRPSDDNGLPLGLLVGLGDEAGTLDIEL